MKGCGFCMPNEMKLYLMIGGCLILGGVIFYNIFIRQSAPPSTPLFETPQTESHEPEEPEDKKIIIVDIKGEVKHPGVYTLDANARVYEVIKLAGGILTTGDDQALNHARVLRDGEMIVIPNKNQDDPPLKAPEKEPALINLNQASVDELSTLPNIGNATAKNIVEYRNKVGEFKTIESIVEVSGIGSATLEAIKDLVTV